MGEVATDYLARQMERMLAEIGNVREDMTVLTAIVMRQDATLTALLNETRAVHSQISRLNDSLRKLENASA